MAARPGIRPASVNLLENNRRSLPVQVLLAPAEHYGADLRSLVQEADMTALTGPRAASDEHADRRQPSRSHAP